MIRYLSPRACLARMLRRPDSFLPFASPHTVQYFIKGLSMRDSVSLPSSLKEIRRRSGFGLPQCDAILNRTGFEDLDCVMHCFVRSANSVDAMIQLYTLVSVADDGEEDEATEHFVNENTDQSEQVDLSDLFQAMRDRPTAFFPEASFSLMSSYLSGLNYALQNWGVRVNISPDLCVFEQKVQEQYGVETLPWHKILYYSHPNEAINYREFFKMLKRWEMFNR